MRTAAEKIAIAAKRLNDLRENWLNPSEWTQRVPEVIPLGMDASPYPDRILPKHGHEKDLAERTLTKLYNQRPAWLDTAHKTLDAAVVSDGPKAHKNGGQARFLDSRLESCLILQGK